MDAHTHTWLPVPLERGRYLCACGAKGYRRPLAGVVEYAASTRGARERATRNEAEHEAFMAAEDRRRAREHASRREG